MSSSARRKKWRLQSAQEAAAAVASTSPDLWENATEVASFSDAQGPPPAYDEATGLLRGGKICGVYSPTHRRRWPLDVLRQHVNLYEGAPCHVDHDAEQPAGGRRPRSVTSLLGTWHSVHAREDGLYGDLHANPAHPMARQMGWWANQKKAGVGFSHNVDYRHKRRADGIREALEIGRVYSVDLVANPGTTRSATEQSAAAGGAYDPNHTGIGDDANAGDDSANETEDMTMPVDLAKMSAEELKALRPDLFAAAQESAAAKVAAEATEALRAELAALKAEKLAAARLSAAMEWADGLGLSAEAAEKAATLVASIADDAARTNTMSVIAAAAEASVDPEEDDDDDDTEGDGIGRWPTHRPRRRAAAQERARDSRRPSTTRSTETLPVTPRRPAEAAQEAALYREPDTMKRWGRQAIYSVQ